MKQKKKYLLVILLIFLPFFYPVTYAALDIVGMRGDYASYVYIPVYFFIISSLFEKKHNIYRFLTLIIAITVSMVTPIIYFMYMILLSLTGLFRFGW